MTRAVTVVVLTLLLVLPSAAGIGEVAFASESRPRALIGSTASAPRPVTFETQVADSPTATSPLLHASSVVRIPPVALAPGDEGSMVSALQTLLTAAGFYRSEIDGEFGNRTAQAVIAFHKAIDAERSSTWNEGDWDLLSGYRPSVPHRPDEPNRLELDLSRQILYRFEDGTIVDIIPISSGNGESYYNAAGNLVRARTPRGDFSFYRHVSGWRISYLGGLYQPWYFRGGYAIHGSNSVPAYPASHGCVRIPNWEADHLAGELWLGLPVHVWDDPPAADPPLFDVDWDDQDRSEPSTFTPTAT